MIKRIGNLIKMILLSMVLLTTGSCDRQGAIGEKLDVAEYLMNTRPDSVLVLLESIPASNIKGKKMEARYALLKSMALDKNYINTTTFDVLQPAIDYYVKNGTPDEQLRTYYYQGRIYQNQGNDDAAMQSFMNCCDLKQKVTDSLLMAHTLVAQGALYHKQYKTKKFIHNNIEAAKLYGAIGRDFFEIKSYTKALDGYIVLNDKSAADSLISICIPLAQKNSDGAAYLFSSLLSYTIEFCSSDDIKAFLEKYQNLELTKNETMNFAYGYSKIGEYDKALNLLAKISPDTFAADSLKYAAVKIGILEKQGKYKQALYLYKDYSAMLERYQEDLLSQGLLFSDEKHQLEMKNLMEIQNRNRIILGTVCGILGLIILVSWLYYQGYLSRTRRILAEKENKNLRLEQYNLRKEKENAELERNKRILEAENLEKDKQRLEAEQRLHELETANLKLEITQLESERDNLKELQREQSELARPIQDVIKNRLDMLNSLLAKEITQNDNYAEPYNKWIGSVHHDKKMFMNSTRLAFTASHPKFIEYLEQHGLSTDEINYLCLYAIGLRGKEVGEYMQLKRHYIISSEIRKKLGLGEHETNIGLYIRRQMKDLEE